MSTDFDSKTTYSDDDNKYIKAKIKTYEDSITTTFYNKKGSKKIPEEKIPQKCFYSLCIWKVSPQIFLEECKYAKENIKTENYIDKELKSESDTDAYTDTDNEE